MSTPQQRPRHFSMLRDLQLADFFTLANAACGMGSVFYAMYLDRKSTRLNSSHSQQSRMPSSA